MPQYIDAGRNISIRVDESAPIGVVIAALEIVEVRFIIVVVTTITEGVEDADGICGCAFNGEVTPSIVFILYDFVGVQIIDGYDIALEILFKDIAVKYTVRIGGLTELHAEGRTGLVVEVY